MTFDSLLTLVRSENAPVICTDSRLVKDILDMASVPHHPEIISHFTGYSRLHSDISFCIKTRPIKSLLDADIDVRVYGKHWKNVSGFKKVAGDTIENGKELNNLSCQARICLNNSPGVSFHMRTVEILGSGAFMLSRKIKKCINHG